MAILFPTASNSKNSYPSAQSRHSKSSITVKISPTANVPESTGSYQPAPSLCELVGPSTLTKPVTPDLSL